jgi:hypothetical protein
MSTQPTAGMQGTLSGAATAEGGRQSGDEENRVVDEGVAVGEADREADVERSGAGGEDAVVSERGTALNSDVAGTASSSEEGVPVGAADAEADRRRTTDADGA